MGCILAWKSNGPFQFRNFSFYLPRWILFFKKMCFIIFFFFSVLIFLNFLSLPLSLLNWFPMFLMFSRNMNLGTPPPSPDTLSQPLCILHCNISKKHMFFFVNHWDLRVVVCIAKADKDNLYISFNFLQYILINYLLNSSICLFFELFLFS